MRDIITVLLFAIAIQYSGKCRVEYNVYFVYHFDKVCKHIGGDDVFFLQMLQVSDCPNHIYQHVQAGV
jgi:hypothetical protein